MPRREDNGSTMKIDPARRKRKILIASVFLHVLFIGGIAAIGVTLSVESLGLLAAAAIVFVMLLVSFAYFRFGREPAERMREGPVALSRGYMLFVSWALLGYLTVILVVGSKLPPSDFILALLGFYALFVVFVFLILVWGRQRRAEAADIK